jgi:hypothetical protein
MAPPARSDGRWEDVAAGWTYAMRQGVNASDRARGAFARRWQAQGDPRFGGLTGDGWARWAAVGELPDARTGVTPDRVVGVVVSHGTTGGRGFVDVEAQTPTGVAYLRVAHDTDPPGVDLDGDVTVQRDPDGDAWTLVGPYHPPADDPPTAGPDDAGPHWPGLDDGWDSDVYRQFHADHVRAADVSRARAVAACWAGTAVALGADVAVSLPTLVGLLLALAVAVALGWPPTVAMVRATRRAGRLAAQHYRPPTGRR